MGDDRDEKEMQKREEKAPEEKSWDEKWQRDPVNSVVWAAIFIWAGLVLLADNLGYLTWLRQLAYSTGNVEFVGGTGAWSLIFLGAGVIVFLGVVARILLPEYRRPLSGSLFFAVILVGIGLGNLFGWNVIWPLILIALGLSIILRGMMRSNR